MSTPTNNTVEAGSKTENDTRFIIKIREQAYYIEVWMHNMLENFDPLPVPFFCIEGLAIEESLMDWFVKGWIVISNDFEMFERGALSVKSGSYNREQEKAPYTFRTDGRNKVSVKLYPLSKDPDNNGADKGNQDIPAEQWQMNYDFVIYDIEDLNTGNVSKKLKKLYLWDERYQILKERNLEWSTSTTGLSMANDKQRSIPSTDAIRSLLSKVGDNIKIGNLQGNLSGSPSIPFDNIDILDWDLGSSGDDGLIFYTSPAYTSALDDLNYICDYLKSNDGTPLFLRFDRFHKTWKLLSLGYYLTNSYKNQVERIVVCDNLYDDGGSNENNKKTPYMPRAHYDINNISGDDNMIRNFQSSIASRIINYKFTPMVSADDMRITNTPIHEYDFSNNSFNIYTKDNCVTKLLKNIQNAAQGGSAIDDGLYSYKKSNQLLMNINTSKQNGYITTNHFVNRTFFPKDIGAVKMMKDFIFLNEAIYFTAPGLSIRAPGKFLFVDREGSNHESNPFDDKFLGQWMIIKVVHLFTKETYITDVVATKIDSYAKWFDVLDSTDKGNY